MLHGKYNNHFSFKINSRKNKQKYFLGNNNLIKRINNYYFDKSFSFPKMKNIKIYVYKPSVNNLQLMQMYFLQMFQDMMCHH